jgi:hypothetical protein
MRFSGFRPSYNLDEVFSNVVSATDHKIFVTLFDIPCRVPVVQPVQPVAPATVASPNVKRKRNMFEYSQIHRTDGASGTSASESTALNSEQEIRRQCQDELLRFRCASQVPMFVAEGSTTQRDPLEWWSQKYELYPTVWLLARYYLAIPATSALSERCFSAAGRLMSPQRAGKIRSDNFEETYFVKRNLHLL